MSSIVLDTETPQSTERFRLNRCRRSSGDGCRGGMITAGVDLREELSGFDKCKGRSFSKFLLEALKLRTIITISLTFFYRHCLLIKELLLGLELLCSL